MLMTTTKSIDDVKLTIMFVLKQIYIAITFQKI